MMYNKEDFVNKMAQRGYTKKACRQIVDDLFDTIADILIDGDGVMFRGFGTFDIRTRSARMGTNPITQEALMIPETKSVRFAVSAPLRRSIKEALEG